MKMINKKRLLNKKKINLTNLLRTLILRINKTFSYKKIQNKEIKKAMNLENKCKY